MQEERARHLYPGSPLREEGYTAMAQLKHDHGESSMRRSAFLLLAATLAGLAGTAADAAPRRASTSNDIVVTKRSYFDAGTLVKPGSLGSTTYVSASQNATPPYRHIVSQFGGETLPLPGELGNCCDVPIARFDNR